MAQGIPTSKPMILRLLIACGAALLANCGGGGGSSPAPVKVDEGAGTDGGTGSGNTRPDFSDVDASFQNFIDGTTDFDGISYVLVDAEGVIHQAVFGDHTD